MSILTQDQILSMIQRKSSRATVFHGIDRSKPYMPEHLSQLYHTPLYDSLSHDQKLRYNQLFALRSIEQLMSLEAFFIKTTLERSKSRSRHSTALLQCMQEMANEEDEHYAMFLELNKKAEPAIYTRNDMMFARLSTIEHMTLKCLLAAPGIVIFLLWVILVMEEFSTYVSRQTLRTKQTSLGTVDENFILAHKRHLQDEIRHVSVCANLLHDHIKHTSGKIIRINAGLFQKFMQEYMTPKRGGIRVIGQLCKEFPELKSTQPAMIRAIQNHSPDKVLGIALNDEKSMPVSNELFKCYPAFSL